MNRIVFNTISFNKFYQPLPFLTTSTHSVTPEAWPAFANLVYLLKVTWPRNVVKRRHSASSYAFQNWILRQSTNGAVLELVAWFIRIFSRNLTSTKLFLKTPISWLANRVISYITTFQVHVTLRIQCHLNMALPFMQDSLKQMCIYITSSIKWRCHFVKEVSH